MGQQIIKQPNGKYCLYSSVVDDFVLIDATKEEICHHFIEAETERINVNVDRIIGQLERGENPYYQFTMTFDMAVNAVKELHGDTAESLMMLREGAALT